MVTVAPLRSHALLGASGAGYQPAPELAAVLGGEARLARGHEGPAVEWLQTLLNRLGAQPPLAVDGLFGPRTEAALSRLLGGPAVDPGGATAGGRAPSLHEGLGPDALLVDRILRGLGQRAPARAPMHGGAAPAGSVPARQLRPDAGTPGRASTPRSGTAPTAGAAGPAAVAPAPGQTVADARLEGLQRAAVESARRELEAGVRETAPNRSARIDTYARDAGMPVGGEWCGYFTGFAYAEAAREAGGRFPENIRFHSFQKARSFFEYRTFTDASRAENARQDGLLERHRGEGSTRQWMVLEGSGGQAHAERHGRPHTIHSVESLPIRPGDTALFSRGHVGMVEGYDPATGRLTTLEGNTDGGRVSRHTYDLSDPAVRARFEGFGRPALGDFRLPEAPAAPAEVAEPAALAAAGTPRPPEATPAAAALTRWADAAEASGDLPAVRSASVLPDLGAVWSRVEAAGREAWDRLSDLFGAGTARPAAAPSVPAAPPVPAVEAPATAGGVEAPAGRAATPVLALPPRPADALTGSQFLEATRHLSRPEREAAILRELERGNVPESLRAMKPVQLEGTGPDGQPLRATVHVLPDYLSIGSEEDSIRIPMDPRTAQRIADLTGTSLPTSRIVDEVWRQAEHRLDPRPLPAGPRMMSNGYYGEHEQRVDAQARAAGVEPGALVAGQKKDIVLSNRLADHPDRVAIYGWHQANGRPIQPVSTIHENSYADYSHGVRLVAGTITVNGVERPLADALRDPVLARLLSAEGPLRVTRQP
jgi:hypothetical protein